MNFNQALGIVRLMIDGGVSREDALANPAIPSEFKSEISRTLESEDLIILEPPKMILANPQHDEWLHQLDRSDWYYWPVLREHLLKSKHWSTPSVNSLDDTTDRILGQLESPIVSQFDIRGLVVGYVQSGKTANYTALIAKAVDVGYRLIIVLSGMDKGLRRQTQIRLNKELVGYSINDPAAVRLPPRGKQWIQYTTEDHNGDFQPGYANFGSLQGTQPVLLVIKKNGAVLRRLLNWLDLAPEEGRRNLPVLVIDDEADQASIDTRGTYQADGEPVSDEDVIEDPSVINGLIRMLLKRFQKSAYVAYTATPFANILIPHDNENEKYKNDLYPKDFIVDLPKQPKYLGAEELFGKLDTETGEIVGGMDIIRPVPELELEKLKEKVLPATLEKAMLDFVLAGAARAYRGQGEKPATMLIHGSHLIQPQLEVEKLVSEKFMELKNEWRYQKNLGIEERMEKEWDDEFRPRLTQEDIKFSAVKKFITPFFESVQVRVINSAKGDVLDYEREPSLKAIAVGGNRLSRGLTLEGLLVSYFVRSTAMYDTLMQMGRWFGYRDGYEDLTRIFMTQDLAGWFRDLALVEYELRKDIQIYESENLTPLEIGVRILRHPGMLVTSRLKQRHASTIEVEQSYSNKSLETVRFPFQDPQRLFDSMENNLNATRVFAANLGSPSWDDQGPVWLQVSPNKVLDFLNSYDVYSESRNFVKPLLMSYIEKMNDQGELMNWTIAIRGRATIDQRLSDINLGLERPIYLNGRTRLKSDPESIGSVSSPNDEGVGMTEQELAQAKEIMENSDNKFGWRTSLRMARNPNNGLLLIYPISRFSGFESDASKNRRSLFDDPKNSLAKDIIGISLSFPKTDKASTILGQYVVGTVGWRSL